MTKKSNNPDSEPTTLAAKITSSRAFIGVIVAAIITGIATISGAVINSCGSGTKPSPSPSPLSFTGRVFNRNNPEQTIRNAQVSLEGEGTPPLATTDSKGVFSFPISDPNREIRIRIEANEYDAFDLRVVPAKTQGIQPIPLTPKTETKAELSGTVVDSKGSRLQGALVTLDDMPRMKPVETSTDGILPSKTFQSLTARESESV